MSTLMIHRFLVVRSAALSLVTLVSTGFLAGLASLLD